MFFVPGGFQRRKIAIGKNHLFLCSNHKTMVSWWLMLVNSKAPTLTTIPEHCLIFVNEGWYPNLWMYDPQVSGQGVFRQQIIVNSS